MKGEGKMGWHPKKAEDERAMDRYMDKSQDELDSDQVMRLGDPKSLWNMIDK